MTNGESSAEANHETEGRAEVEDHAQKEQTEGHSDENQKSIRWQDHQRALNDLKKYKAQARQAADELEQLKSSLSEQKRKKLEDANDYEALYRSAKQELESEREKADRWKTYTIQNTKLSEVKPALQRAGLRQEAERLLDLEDLSDVEVEATDQGRFIVHGVDGFVERMRQNYPFAFQQKKMPGIDSTSGHRAKSFEEKPLTREDVLRIERECKQKGDMGPYHEAVHRYRKQRQ